MLAGLSKPDDAAIWKLDEQRALVVTTDFFTPVVDDPYDYGVIAAANSLSDIYAMGGTPFLALNIAALPPQLPPEHVKFAAYISQEQQMLLFDPQTSGGLLFAVSPGLANQCEQDAVACKLPLWRVGEVTSTGTIEVG